MRLQSPQYTGRSDFGSNGSSSIATPQSAHFKSRCRTSNILRSPKAIRSPFVRARSVHIGCRRRSPHRPTVPQLAKKRKACFDLSTYHRFLPIGEPTPSPTQGPRSCFLTSRGPDSSIGYKIRWTSIRSHMSEPLKSAIPPT